MRLSRRAAFACGLPLPFRVVVGLLLALALLSGCDALGTTGTVRIVLPEMPPAIAAGGALPAEPAYRVEWNDHTGRRRWTVASPGVREVLLRIDTTPGTPVLAYPIFRDVWDHFLPAGGIYPDGVEAGERLVLSWRDGFLAERYRSLIDRGIATEIVNTAKVRRRIDIVAGPDPWILDSVLLENEMAQRTLSAESVQRRQTREVRLGVGAALAAALAPGTWLFPSLLAAPIVVALDGPASPDGAASPGPATARAARELPIGYHRLYHVESGRILSFEVSPQPRLAVVTTWPRY